MIVPTEYEQGHADGVRETERAFAVILVAICQRNGGRIEVPHNLVAEANWHDLHWGQDPLKQFYFYEVKNESSTDVA